MKHPRFDAVTRLLGALPSRRHLLSGLVATALGLGAVRLPDLDARKKKRRHKKRKKIKQLAAAPNAFGCIDVGELCQSDGQCCSGVCAGKEGTKTCRAHDVGDCAAGAALQGCGGADVECMTGAGLQGFCATTTGNAGYCQTAAECYVCQTDVDCQAASGGELGPTAACIQCAECATTGGTACATTKDFV